MQILKYVLNFFNLNEDKEGPLPADELIKRARQNANETGKTATVEFNGKKISIPPGISDKETKKLLSL